jgi:RNA polymerase-binding transcription factor DksA
MAQGKPTREQLERRRDEINEQLNRVNAEERIELDRDPEEQAIQLEQDQVPITMEANLRRELADIEDRLLDMGEGG